ncbi:MAG: transcriptional repressor [Bdellovibrionales bacterium]|nr:transcriptional repressor [Bdellovibrionales bacterium]
MAYHSEELVRGQSGEQQPEVLLDRKGSDLAQKKRVIRKMGLKVTQQRLAILDVLIRGKAHVTAQEVFDEVSSAHPEIGFATVYRFLRSMSDHQLVNEVRMGGLPARYELSTPRHHDHLTCTKCGRIVEFENPQIESLQVAVARENGFYLTGHVLELYGVCSSCQVVGTGDSETKK